MNTQNSDNGRGQSKGRKWALIVLNFLLICCAGIFLIWLMLQWLNIWTDHGDELLVPDVKGVYFDDARNRLENAGLGVELSDSVYDSSLRPGAVVDQNPKVGTHVKPGRTIYLTINAFAPKMVSIPSLNDISARQARSILEGLGITDVSEEIVISEYANLVLGARYNGRQLNAGARVPVTAHIILEVGDGMPEMPDSIAPADTIAVSSQVSFF